MKERILIADDDPAIMDGSTQVLTRSGYEVMQAATGAEAWSMLEQYEFDLVLLDLKLPDINGLDLLRRIREQNSLVPVVMITAYGTVQNAVEAMRMGANDFLPKPFEPDELRFVVQRTLRTKQLALENIYLKEELKKKEGEVRIVGNSKALRDLLGQIERVAPTDSTVLITGESGTGKGLVARMIHELSSRRDYPFVSVDCSTLVPSLFESELFGHVKGAFTGAGSNKIGKFELASGGSLFLDEIANINLDLQAKLLKAVEEKVISRVGSHRLTKVDVRIIAATNKNLKEAVREGSFREDLFFRLNVVALRTPPLRERMEDIPLLVDYFLKRFRNRHRRPDLIISSKALELLGKYHWPGNVRELENTVERLVIFAKDRVIGEEDVLFAGIPVDKGEPVQDLEIWHKGPGSGIQKGNGKGLVSLEEVEKQYIMKVLEQTRGNRTEAASILGIDRKTLRMKLKRWGIE